MSHSDHLRRLADLVDALEAADVPVESVSLAFEDGEARVDLTVDVGDADASVLRSAMEGHEPAGRGEADPASAGAPGPDTATGREGDEPAADGDGRDAESAGDAGPTYPCEHHDCDSVFGTEHGMKVHYGRMHGDDAGTDDAEAPTEDATAPAEDPDAPTDDPGASDPDQPLADVPSVAGIEAVEVKAAVEDADTLHEVATALELDREAAGELLAGLDLLELVHGRVATKRSRDERKAEIADRLRENLDREPAD